MKLYTYVEMAEIFRVKPKTIANWKYQKEFKVFGYKRIGKWAKIALVEESEVKLLCAKKFTIPDYWR